MRCKAIIVANKFASHINDASLYRPIWAAGSFYWYRLLIIAFSPKEIAPLTAHLIISKYFFAASPQILISCITPDTLGMVPCFQ